MVQLKGVFIRKKSDVTSTLKWVYSEWLANPLSDAYRGWVLSVWVREDAVANSNCTNRRQPNRTYTKNSNKNIAQNEATLSAGLNEQIVQIPNIGRSFQAFDWKHKKQK